MPIRSQADFVFLCKWSSCFSALMIEEGETSGEKHYSYNTLFKLWKLWEVSTEGGFNRVPWELMLQGVSVFEWMCACTTHVSLYVCVCVCKCFVCLMSERMFSVVGWHVTCITHQRKVSLTHRVRLKVRARLYIEQTEGWALSKLSLGERLLEVTKPSTWRSDLMS